MSQFEENLAKFTKNIENLADFGRHMEKKFILGSTDHKYRNSDQKDSNSAQNNSLSSFLSETEIKAFKGLCAMEGKSGTEKVTELINNYIEKMQKRMAD